MPSGGIILKDITLGNITKETFVCWLMASPVILPKQLTLPIMLIKNINKTKEKITPPNSLFINKNEGISI
jgi:hypothetical protein